MTHEYRIIARWDNEAGVWWAESDEVPGLCVESPTFEGLEREIALLIDDLLLANGIIQEADKAATTFRISAEKSGVAAAA